MGKMKRFLCALLLAVPAFLICSPDARAAGPSVISYLSTYFAGGTNGQVWTQQTSGTPQWANAGGGASFPLRAPDGSLGANAAYSFASTPLAGMLWDGSNLVLTPDGSHSAVLDASLGNFTVSAASHAWSGFIADNSNSPQAFRVTSRGGMGMSADGVMLLQDWAADGFTAVQFGGTTASFPEMKVNGTTINFRLANDSADAAITALQVGVPDANSGGGFYIKGHTFDANGMVVVVACSGANGRTGAFNFGSTYTVGATDELIRVSGQITVSSISGGTNSFSLQVTFTDALGSVKTLTIPVVQNGSSAGPISLITDATGVGDYSGQGMIVRAKAGTVVQVKVAGTFATVNYETDQLIEYIRSY